ncbi:uncharacterized protein PAC_11813 [Phialocephala subalpina]|uniref:Uncharacterized protein n=1 Tax=Phialocephala subalpina TaxID=576137 RepID=A0A1L7XAA7_9HELO|nr:uncharacterized protein PAC_11813 [Phialocephala subalpina]
MTSSSQSGGYEQQARDAFDRCYSPSTHRATFANIKKLGRLEFFEYRESITVDSEENPWREQTKRRAERIATLARICRDGRKNEAGWRMSLESEILARFTIEVACRRCRARLWRSELEAAASDQLSASLEERRKERRPCTCRTGRRGLDSIEQGVNLLFDDRAQEAIIYDIDLQSAMQKKEEPDRVFGLRSTKRLDRLLRWTEDRRVSSGGKMIGDSLRSTPFRPDGEPIVFPFLVLEAKSEKGRDNFSDIETQTAFAVHSLLTLQEDLRTAAGDDSEWESGSLVWFLAYKGEQWRVSAAYIDYLLGIRHHHIVDLWDGRILSASGALQLLLIVDYIFDWARDVYREAIIGELRSLAIDNTTSLGNDSDMDRSKQASGEQEAESPMYEEATAEKVEDPLRAFDSPKGVVRDANYMRNRFICLYITEDNLSVLMTSMKTSEKAQTAAENILRLLKDAWRVSREAIDALELLWTGEDRENMSLISSPDWQQTMELCCIAVSQGVIEELFQYAKRKGYQGWVPDHWPWVQDLTNMKVYLSMSVKDNLLATISRASISTKLFTMPTESTRTKADEEMENHSFWAVSSEKLDNGLVKHRYDAAMVPNAQARTRQFVLNVYNLHKIGRNESSSSILRVSSKFEEQRKLRPGGTTMGSIWPRLFVSVSPENVDQNFVFVTSKNPGNMTEYAKLCIFVLDASKWHTLPDQDELECPAPAYRFQAMRMDTKPGWGSGCNKADVQIHEDEFWDHMRAMIQHLIKIESFSEDVKGKGIEQPKPWKPKKMYTNWRMTTTRPSSFASLLKFREQAVNHRATAITVNEKLNPDAEQLLDDETALVGTASIEPPGGFTEQGFIDGTPETTTFLSIAKPLKQGKGKAIVVSSPKAIPPRVPFDHGSGITLEDFEFDDDTTSAGPSTEQAQKIDDRVQKRRSLNFGAGEGPSSTGLSKQQTQQIQETQQVQRTVPKRTFEDVDPGEGPSSAGPSKRPRQQETVPQFDRDYLDDEELSILLESGEFGN